MAHIWAQELVVQTFWKLEIFDVQPRFISFLKIHLLLGLVHKILISFMCLFKIGFNDIL
jgi:hypothetical protein